MVLAAKDAEHLIKTKLIFHKKTQELDGQCGTSADLFRDAIGFVAYSIVQTDCCGLGSAVSNINGMVRSGVLMAEPFGILH